MQLTSLCPEARHWSSWLDPYAVDDNNFCSLLRSAKWRLNYFWTFGWIYDLLRPNCWNTLSMTQQIKMHMFQFGGLFSYMDWWPLLRLHQPSYVLFRHILSPRRDGRDMSSERQTVKAFRIRKASCCVPKLCPLSPTSEICNWYWPTLVRLGTVWVNKRRKWLRL